MNYSGILSCMTKGISKMLISGIQESLSGGGRKLSTGCMRSIRVIWRNLTPVSFIIAPERAAVELEQEFYATEDMSSFLSNQ